MRQTQSVLGQTGKSLTQKSLERSSWKPDVPREKRSADGNNRVGHTLEETGPEHRAKNYCASASAGNMRAAARRRSPEPLARTLRPAAERATTWRSHDAL